MAPILPSDGVYARNSTTPTPTPTPTPLNPNISSYNTSNIAMSPIPSTISTSLTPFPTSTTTSSATPIGTNVDNPENVALSSMRPFIAPIILIIVGFIITSFLCCCVRWSRFRKSKGGDGSNPGLRKKVLGGGSVSSSTANIICDGNGEHRCSNCGTFITTETDLNDDDQGTSVEETERPDSSRVSFHLKVEEFGKGRKRRDGNDESENGSNGDCPPIVKTKSSFIEIIDAESDSQSISPVPSLRSETPPPERPSTPIATSSSPKDRTSSERLSSATLIAEEKEENVDEVEVKKANEVV